MANQDAPFGLRPIGRIGGTHFNGGQNRYRIAANYGTSIFQGDMVAQVTGGTVEIHADGGTVPIVGVFNGCEYTDPTTGKVTLVTIIQQVLTLLILLHLSLMTLWLFLKFKQMRVFPITDLFGNFDIVYTQQEVHKAVFQVLS